MRSATRVAGFSERFAVTLAIGVGLLPGVQLYAAWASGAPIGWVCAASIVASRQLVTSAEPVPRGTYAGAVALLVLSALTYQTAVGFFVVGLCLALLSPHVQHKPSQLVTRHVRALAAAMGIVLVWMVAARIMLGKGERTPFAAQPAP